MLCTFYRLLQNNQISGSIPFEIGKLSQLETLDFSNNQFAGEIPTSLGFLNHLNYLRLSKNNLYGQIPQSVASLSDLTFLDLSFNNLSGPVPRILAKEYSFTGNKFICKSSFQRLCEDVRKQAKEPTSSGTDGNRHIWVVAVAVGMTSAFVLTAILFVCWLYWCRWRVFFGSYVQQDYELDAGQLKRLSFRELQVATDNFSAKNILGHGGFGVVYKGCLRNRTIVAVKRLKDPNFTGEVQFQTEVEMIGLVLHRNLLRLYGFCMTSNERLLVYPFMSNGSVADRLRDPCTVKPSLDWNRRIHIALGAARGLLYLHEQCNPKIIHRDVKAANILLDESFEAVVGDFGLAKLLDQRESHVTTAVRGTVGHIAPEYLSTGQSSEKTDVFGFGVLLLELITGQKALDAGNGQVRKGMILDWVRTLYEEKRLEVLVDRDLGACFNSEELEKVVDAALLCTRSQPSQRPKMSEVVRILEGIAGPGNEEEPQEGGSCEERSCSFYRDYNDTFEGSSFIIEAMELSGPR
ncbi:hypothetical protein Syun_027933 [Stephania yunnanensis]|uniref:non-specific serine/threonine protein kinase n=1 Tax=Stephania yunnanensis TaxID=152371 RepID=A0AAP0EJT4_9MAGN